MDIVRVSLALGMVAHKLLWEVLRRQNGAGSSGQSTAPLGARGLVKGVKAAVLLFLLIQTLFLDILPIASQPSLVRSLGIILYFGGLATAMLGRVQLGNNWVDLEDYQVLDEQQLVTQGIYRYMRHPIYTGDILLLIGLELALNSWLVVATALPLVVVIRQALHEDVLLARAFPGYSTYCTRTKRFIPFIV